MRLVVAGNTDEVLGFHLAGVESHVISRQTALDSLVKALAGGGDEVLLILGPSSSRFTLVQTEKVLTVRIPEAS